MEFYLSSYMGFLQKGLDERETVIDRRDMCTMMCLLWKCLTNQLISIVSA